MSAVLQAEVDELEEAVREEQRRFLEAHKVWNRDTKPSNEAAMLRAALPMLRRLENDLARRETVKARALHQVLDAVEDGLDGHGWHSLTVGKAGQGFNLAQ